MNIDIRHFEDVLALMGRFETLSPLLDGYFETPAKMAANWGARLTI